MALFSFYNVRRSRTYKNVRLLVAAAVLAALFWFLFMQ